MKHETIFPVEHLRQRSLPDAPLAMHPQVLERRRVHWNIDFLFSLFPHLRRE